MPEDPYDAKPIGILDQADIQIVTVIFLRVIRTIRLTGAISAFARLHVIFMCPFLRRHFTVFKTARPVAIRAARLVGKPNYVVLDVEHD